MDNLLEKFGIYDFFGLVIPGMMFLYALVYMNFPLIDIDNYDDSAVLLVIGFLLLSYMCGIWMQEMGSFLDNNFWKIRKSARTKYLDTRIERSKFKSWFIIEYTFHEEEAQRILNMVEGVAGKEGTAPWNEDERRKKCKDAFFVCKAHLENMNRLGKAEKLNAMYAMGRDLIVCNILVMICLFITIMVNKTFEVECYFLITYILISSVMFYRRAKRFAVMRVKTIIRQYIAMNQGYR